MRRLVVGDYEIDDEHDCFVIAEIGHNHQGDVEKAKELIRTAHRCGVHAVKLQKRDNKTLFTSAFYSQVYNSENAFGTTYGEHREFLEFGRDEYLELQQFCDDLGVLFFATAFDIPSADFLADLDVPAYKIASGDLTNVPLLRHVARFGKPMFVSTGGGTMADVVRAHDEITAINRQLCLLQCTAGYPPAWDELNLRVITTFRDRFPDTVVGLSSHDSGIAMALVGYALGARVIEKHFTLNRAWKGTDHAFSLEPSGMRKLVRDLERARVAVGNGVKARYPSEEAPLSKMAKSLVAARDLPAGHVLTAEDLAARSPAITGLPPSELDRLVGRRIAKPLAADTAIDEAVLDDR